VFVSVFEHVSGFLPSGHSLGMSLYDPFSAKGDAVDVSHNGSRGQLTSPRPCMLHHPAGFRLVLNSAPEGVTLCVEKSLLPIFCLPGRSVTHLAATSGLQPPSYEKETGDKKEAGQEQRCPEEKELEEKDRQETGEEAGKGEGKEAEARAGAWHPDGRAAGECGLA
jgi:hypothetical protein